MVCWSEFTDVGRATRDATLGTNGARADTVVFIFCIMVLSSSIDFWRSSMAAGEPEQAEVVMIVDGWNLIGARDVA